LLQVDGRYKEALSVVEQKAEYTRRAGLGPWSQLGDEGRRLQILGLRGENEGVLRRVTELREYMKTLPDPPRRNEAVTTWNVRETLLDTGRSSALRLGEWQQALDFNRERRQSQSDRDAPALEQARTAFNDYGPLLRLTRYDEAQAVLFACREVFERENSIDALGAVYGALAQLEDARGHPETAQGFEKTALRYKYTHGDPASAAVSHSNIAEHFIKDHGARSEALAHRLGAVMIGKTMGSGDAAQWLAALAGDIRRAGPEGHAALPADFDALCAAVEKVEGVRFREMVERLAGGELFRQVVAEALKLAEKSE